MNIRALLLSSALVTIPFSLPLSGWSWSPTEWWTTITGRYQEDVETHKYPFPDPKQVIVEGNIGNITIKSWQHDALTIEVVKKGSSEHIDDTTVQASINNGVARFTTHTPAHTEAVAVDYTLIIPAKTPHLSIKLARGLIVIKNGSGTIDVTSEDGSIDIRDSTASITAHAQGSISVIQQSFSPHGSIFLKARDSITVALSGHANGRISARTTKGSIFSSLYITLDPITTTITPDTWDRLKRFIQGTIGSGGASITLETENGIIDIREL